MKIWALPSIRFRAQPTPRGPSYSDATTGSADAQGVPRANSIRGLTSSKEGGLSSVETSRGRRGAAGQETQWPSRPSGRDPSSQVSLVSTFPVYIWSTSGLSRPQAPRRMHLTLSGPPSTDSVITMKQKRAGCGFSLNPYITGALLTEMAAGETGHTLHGPTEPGPCSPVTAQPYQ